MQRAFPTSEGQALELTLAGADSRTAAWILDGLVLVMALFVTWIVLFFLSSFDPTGLSDLAVGMLGSGLVLLVVGYPTSFAFFGRPSYGKQRLGIEVVDEHGASATLPKHLIRNLVFLIELVPLPLPLGFLVILVHTEHRRLGDVMAGTYVVFRTLDVDDVPVSKRKTRRKRAREAQLDALEIPELTPARFGRLGERDWRLLQELSARVGLRSGVHRDLEGRLALHLARKLRLDQPEEWARSAGSFLLAVRQAGDQMRKPA